jgi:hypothetical protein
MSHILYVYDSQDAVSPREQYEWVPNTCQLLAWNATQFCQLLGEYTIPANRIYPLFYFLSCISMVIYRDEKAYADRRLDHAADLCLINVDGNCR